MMLRVHYREDEVFLRRMYIVNRNERKSFHPSITALQPRDAVKYFTHVFTLEMSGIIYGKACRAASRGQIINEAPLQSHPSPPREPHSEKDK